MSYITDPKELYKLLMKKQQEANEIQKRAQDHLGEMKGHFQSLIETIADMTILGAQIVDGNKRPTLGSLFVSLCETIEALNQILLQKPFVAMCLEEVVKRVPKPSGGDNPERAGTAS